MMELDELKNLKNALETRHRYGEMSREYQERLEDKPSVPGYRPDSDVDKVRSNRLKTASRIAIALSFVAMIASIEWTPVVSYYLRTYGTVFGIVVALGIFIAGTIVYVRNEGDSFSDLRDYQKINAKFWLFGPLLSIGGGLVLWGASALLWLVVKLVLFLVTFGLVKLAWGPLMQWFQATLFTASGYLVLWCLVAGAITALLGLAFSWIPEGRRQELRAQYERSYAARKAKADAELEEHKRESASLRKDIKRCDAVIAEANSAISQNNVVPDAYKTLEHVDLFLSYFEQRRVGSIRDCINLMISEQRESEHRAAVINQQRAHQQAVERELAEQRQIREKQLETMRKLDEKAEALKSEQKRRTEEEERHNRDVEEQIRKIKENL